jgi:Ribonuclease G/E
MAIELLINVSREESRVARLENGVVTEISIERDRDRGIVGNVYKGRVVKVLPGMQAAFVDIGLAKAAFLYVTDVSHNVEEYARFLEEETGEESVEFETARGRRKKANAAPIEDPGQKSSQAAKAPSREGRPRDVPRPVSRRRLHADRRPRRRPGGSGTNRSGSAWTLLAPRELKDTSCDGRRGRDR